MTLSSSLASHKDRIVPANWAKHSCQTRSGAGRPPAAVSRTRANVWIDRRTGISVVELEEITLLVQLIGVAVQKGEDALELR